MPSLSLLKKALNVGAIDFGDVGEAPPIFAQAAGAPLAYVGATVQRPQSEAMPVPHQSPITRAILGEQQQIADTFFQPGLLPKRVSVLEAAAPGLA